MKQSILIICFQAFINLCCLSQNEVGSPDSLKKVLQLHIQQDTNRVLLLIYLANAVITNTPKEAMQYADEALKISQNISWQKGIALSYRSKGGVYYVLSDLKNSLDYFKKALLADSGKSKFFEATLLNNIANIYGDLKQYNQAIDFYRKQNAICESLNSKEQLLMGYANLGSVYEVLKNYDSTLFYYFKALKILQGLKNERLLSNLYCTIGATYKDMGDYTQSFQFSKRSIEIANKTNDAYVKAPALNNLAWAYFHLSDFTNAEKYSKQSLIIAEKFNNVQWQYEAWELLYNNYEKQKKTDFAFSAYKKYILLKDSVLNNEKKQEITRMEMQYDFNKKEDSTKAITDRKQALIAADLKQQRTVKHSVIAGGAILLGASVVVFIFYKRKRDAQQKQKDAEFKAQVSDTEMKVMRLQMNPHFIFNSLNSISDYIARNKPGEAEIFLSKFAKVMRLTLEHSEQQTITLADDLKTLELYMQLEAKRLTNKFTFEIKVADDIDKENTLVPPMIFQPFVENSIWHGIAKKQGEGHIVVDIQKENEMLVCRIDDDGIGRQAAEVNMYEKQSLGMKITKARIDILNKLKGSSATVQLIDKPQGTTAQLTLPVEQNF